MRTSISVEDPDFMELEGSGHATFEWLISEGCPAADLVRKVELLGEGWVQVHVLGRLPDGRIAFVKETKEPVVLQITMRVSTPPPFLSYPELP